MSLEFVQSVLSCLSPFSFLTRGSPGSYCAPSMRTAPTINSAGDLISAKLGALPPVKSPPSITSAQLFVSAQAVRKALAGQSGLRVLVNATGMNSEAKVYINGTLAPSQQVSEAPSEVARIVNLDTLPVVRDRPGALFVQVRNLNPVSALSDAFIAGELVGPRIESFSLKRKGKGFNLNLIGKGFHPAASIEIKNLAGESIRPKKARIEGETAALIKMRSTAPPPGTELRVRIVNPHSVASNEIIVIIE